MNSWAYKQWIDTCMFFISNVQFTIFDVVDVTLKDYFTFVFILQLYKDSNVLNKIYYNYLQ